MSREALQLTKAVFATEFWETYASYGLDSIFNVDETAINYDMPPARTWAIRGRNGSAKVADLSKHSGRMTAVLTIRADGKLQYCTLFLALSVSIFMFPIEFMER
jgi:hypothetical protein